MSPNIPKCPQMSSNVPKCPQNVQKMSAMHSVKFLSWISGSVHLLIQVSIFMFYISIKFDALTTQPTRKLCLQFVIWNFQPKWYQVFAAAWRNKPPLELEGSKIASTSLFTNFEILNFQSSLLGLLYCLSLLWQAWWPNLPTILCSIKWILFWCLKLHQVSMWCMNLDTIKCQSLWWLQCVSFVKVRRYCVISNEHNLWSA